MKRKLIANQKGIPFIFCAVPITLDMRGSWGDDPSNFQQGPNGAFLKTKPNGDISHLVQPNEDKTAPIGWTRTSEWGKFDKLDIWIDETIHQPGSIVSLQTADGPINYDVKEPGHICYNMDEAGNADPNDSWFQKISDLQKNYGY